MNSCMAAKKGGLGRGLDALFADNSVEENSSASAVKLSLNEIEPNKDQPRKPLMKRRSLSLRIALRSTALFSRF